MKYSLANVIKSTILASAIALSSGCNSRPYSAPTDSQLERFSKGYQICTKEKIKEIYQNSGKTNEDPEFEKFIDSYNFKKDAKKNKDVFPWMNPGRLSRADKEVLFSHGIEEAIYFGIAIGNSR